MRNKKGQMAPMDIKSLMPIGVLLLAALITISIGSIILDKTQVNQKIYQSDRVNNESATTLNSSTAYIVARASLETEFSGTLVDVYNNTIKVGNCSMTAATGSVLCGNTSIDNGTCTNCKVTYDSNHVAKNAFYNTTNDALKGMTTTASFMPIVAIALIGGMLIFLFTGKKFRQDED